MNFLTYVMENSEQILALLIEHVNLTILSVSLAILIGVPLGILISHFSKVNKPIMILANVIQAVPSMALLGFLIHFRNRSNSICIYGSFIFSTSNNKKYIYKYFRNKSTSYRGSRGNRNDKISNSI